MKNKFIKILIISIFIFSIIWMFTTTNYAMNEEKIEYKEEVSISKADPLSGSSAGDFKPDSTTDASNASKLMEYGNVVIGFIRTIASIVSVAVLIIVGIKYMTGSVEEKAEYKNSMMPYVIGAVLAFGITNVLAIIVDVTTSLTN